MAKIYNPNNRLEIAKAILFGSLSNKPQLHLAEAFELSSGDYLPKSKMQAGQHKVYGGGGLTIATHSESNISQRTVGIGRVGARCGCAFIVEPNSWITDNALFISRFKKKFNLNFVMHYLNWANLNQYAKQSAQPVISQSGISRCLLPDIDITEQNEIETILEAIENGSEFKDYFGLTKFLEAEEQLSILTQEVEAQQTYLKLLRQTILQEAVQGKLTHREPTDEPASVLLARIKAEKIQLVKAGKLKKEKELPPITEAEIPFALPEGWVWCRLGEISLKSDAGKSFVCEKREANQSEWGVIKVSAMSWGNFLENENKALPSGQKPNLEYAINVGDYLISRANTEELIGKSVIVKEKTKNLLLSDKSIRIQFSKHVETEYINYFNNSQYAREYYKRVATGTSDSMKNISREQMYCLPVPLPPYIEQQQIVQKIRSIEVLTHQLQDEILINRKNSQLLFQTILKQAFQPQKEVYGINETLSLAAEA